MGVVPTGELQGRREGFAAVAGEAFTTESQVGLDELDVGAFGEGVGYDLFVFLDCDGTIMEKRAWSEEIQKKKKKKQEQENRAYQVE